MWIQCVLHNLLLFFSFNCRTLAKGILCGRELWAFHIRLQNNLMSIVTYKMYIVHSYNILCEQFTVLYCALEFFFVLLVLLLLLLCTIRFVKCLLLLGLVILCLMPWLESQLLFLFLPHFYYISKSSPTIN